MTKRYIRKIRITITEEDGSNPIIFESEGRREDPTIDFHIQKTLSGIGEAVVLLYNLNQETQQRLITPRQNVEIELGYKDDKTLTAAAKGVTMSGFTTGEKRPDILTTLNIIDSYNAFVDSSFNRTYNPNTPIATILRDIIATLPRVALGTIDIDFKLNGIETTPATGSSKRIFHGSSEKILNELSRQYFFSGNIRDGIYSAYDTSKTSGTIFEISFKNGLLMTALPQLKYLTQLVTGVLITSVLDARINPGDIIRLETKTVPFINGDYKATLVTHTGSSHGNEWTTTIQQIGGIGAQALNTKINNLIKN